MMASIFGGAFLAGIALAWFFVATEPVRKAAWIAECQTHDLSEQQCAFIYRVESQRRADEAVNAAVLLSTTAQILRTK